LRYAWARVEALHFVDRVLDRDEAMTAAIEVEGLTKSFGGEFLALNGVGFSVEEGTVLGLLGPNEQSVERALQLQVSPHFFSYLHPSLYMSMDTTFDN